MAMSTHSHQTISHCAYQIWQDYGCPSGCDDAIWFEAELKLTAGVGCCAITATPPASAPPHLGESHSDHAVAEAASQQRKEARAPITSHISAPKSKPAESGKPLWSQPHSS
jgi:hypothetical protein